MLKIRKYREVIFDNTEDWCKIWRKTDLRFQRWHEKFGKFSPVYLEVWSVMAMKNDAKLEEELTCRFKSTRKSQKFAL